MRIEAVLFDNDGTIIDSAAAIAQAFDHAFTTVCDAVPPLDEFMGLVGIPLREQMRHFAPGQVEELVAAYRDFNALHHDRLVRVYPNVKDALEELAGNGMRMGMVTSKLHAIAIRGLALFDIDGYFEEVVGADDCELHKPDPAPLLLCAEKMGVDIGRCLYVGDSPYDLQAANAAGAISVAALWGMYEPLVLRRESPRYEARDIREVPDIASRWQPSPSQ